MTNKSETDTEAQRVLDDVPYTKDRGWRGLAADANEKIAFAGALGAILLLVLVTLVFGLPGLLLMFLLLTLVSFALLLTISVGN